MLQGSDADPDRLPAIIAYAASILPFPTAPFRTNKNLAQGARKAGGACMLQHGSTSVRINITHHYGLTSFECQTPTNDCMQSYTLQQRKRSMERMRDVRNHFGVYTT